MIEYVVSSISMIAFVVLGILIYRTTVSVKDDGTAIGMKIRLRFLAIWVIGISILITGMYILWTLPIDTTPFAFAVVAVFLGSILFPAIMYLLSKIQTKI